MERDDGEHEKKYYEVKDQRYLEEESFIDRIEGQKREVENAVYDVSIEVIAWKVSKVTGITQESVYFDSASEEKIPYYDCLTLRTLPDSERVFSQQEEEQQEQHRLIRALTGTIHHFFGGFPPSVCQCH